MVYLTRKCEFSASHYYHNPEFSAEENQRIFGKCANLNGHGHNYTLEVTVKGAIDPKTGFVVDLKELKETAEIHHHLDAELLGQPDGLLADVLIVGRPVLIRMQRVAVAAQGADGDSVVRQETLEILEITLVLQHGELAVGAAGVISGTEFHGIDLVAFQLLEDTLSGQLRQQRSEYADSHGDSP